MKKRILVIILVLLIILFVSVASIKLFYGAINDNNGLRDELTDKWGDEWVEDKTYGSHRFDISNKHEYNNLEFNNAIFRLFDTGRYTFVVDVTNNSDESIYHKMAEIEFLDKDSNVVFKTFIPIANLDVSKTSEEITTYGDYIDEMRNVIDYRISDLKQMDY